MSILKTVNHGSILSPLLFILYTTPLSTVRSNSAANHHLYADDTQRFLSFSGLDYSYNITHLENTITNVYNWISSNLQSLNPSKTEFIIFGLPQQFSKLKNPTILPNNVILSPVDSAYNLGVIFDKNLSLAQHISAVSKSCFHNIHDLRRKLLPALLLLLSFTLKLTIVILFYSIYLLIKRIIFNLSLTLLLVQQHP